MVSIAPPASPAPAPAPPPSPPKRQRAVYYPESDGKPMAEMDIHVRYMMDLRTALEHHFRHDDQVYVSGNNLLYYEEGNPRASVSPDVYVVHGIPKRERRIYQLWEERQAPSFVLEVTSRSTRRQDLNKKRQLYARLGVQEYLLYDPLGEYLVPPLQGFRLEEGEYRPLHPGADGALASAVLGLELRLEEGRLRFYDPVAGRYLLTRHEEIEARQAAEARAAAAEAQAAEEAAARRQAEAELARLREELARLRPNARL